MDFTSSFQGIDSELRGARSLLPKVVSELGGSKAFIITGRSLNEKTPVIKELESLLADSHAGTYAGVRQHVPVADIDCAIQHMNKSAANIIVAVGGGSPIDAAKAVAYHIHKQTEKWTPIVALPTTLSVAENTLGAGYTNHEGLKVGIFHPEMAPKAIIYDAEITLHTPARLWLSSAVRAIDHAVELQYHPQAAEVPTKRLCRTAIREIFSLLPLCKKDPENPKIRQELQIAAYSALPPFYFTAAIGLSHTIGHVIGATYAIPHGITSCISLAKTIHFKAARNPEEAHQIAKILPYIGHACSGDDAKDANAVGDAIAKLVEGLELKSTLSEFSVKPSEADTIALRALKEDKKDPNMPALFELIRSLY
ncbi:alcohol dehydrogenase IV [Nannizzia gypsea CBS 118893]|uniref:Alcohol dehydrogenase IV n=1 Tax=Arthroderma gypseum (strain ATCC MYA-4604 / CBS 118893) TaxID=535722 RepID=E4UQP8_ARTGP|nr:alcohol dehydrogenase IV [Nannizzia gypsea CBS 118893]EFR00066.1 alcohol dehydrogenase IV [Nannizzia gypsea CBS 118893]